MIQCKYDTRPKFKEVTHDGIEWWLMHGVTYNGDWSDPSVRNPCIEAMDNHARLKGFTHFYEIGLSEYTGRKMYERFYGLLYSKPDVI